MRIVYLGNPKAQKNTVLWFPGVQAEMADAGHELDLVLVKDIEGAGVAPEYDPSHVIAMPPPATRIDEGDIVADIRDGETAFAAPGGSAGVSIGTLRRADRILVYREPAAIGHLSTIHDRIMLSSPHALQYSTDGGRLTGGRVRHGLAALVDDHPNLGWNAYGIRPAAARSHRTLMFEYLLYNLEAGGARRIFRDPTSETGRQCVLTAASALAFCELATRKHGDVRHARFDLDRHLLLGEFRRTFSAKSTNPFRDSPDVGRGIDVGLYAYRLLEKEGVMDTPFYERLLQLLGADGCRVDALEPFVTEYLDRWNGAAANSNRNQACA